MPITIEEKIIPDLSCKFEHLNVGELYKKKYGIDNSSIYLKLTFKTLRLRGCSDYQYNAFNITSNCLSFTNSQELVIPYDGKLIVTHKD